VVSAIAGNPAAEAGKVEISCGWSKGGSERVLTPKITNHLNKGTTLATEVPADVPGTRRFVRIRAIDKPGVPREEFRYINSRYSMWEYWNYEFRRMALRPGWETNEWDYDLYLVHDEKVVTYTEVEFFDTLARWIAEPDCLVIAWESACPDY
jgi:hypothetical protein